MREDIMFKEFSRHKILTHFDKLKKLSEDKDVTPVTVEIDPVNYCNHNCVWCVDPSHGKAKLELEFIYKLVDELKSIDVKGIVLKGGGEPTLHDDFGKIVKYISDKDIELGMVTNGSQLHRFSREIVDNAKYVRISIDGPDQESHYNIHRKKDFNQICKNVRDLVHTRGTNRHPIIGLSFAMNYDMIHLTEKAAELGMNLGVDYIMFRPPFFEEVGRLSTISVDQGIELRKKFADTAKKYEPHITIFVDNWVSDRDALHIEKMNKSSPRRGSFFGKGANGIEHVTKKCWAPPLFAVITADKGVYPCCNLRLLKNWCLGHIDYDAGKSFISIWEGDERKEIMEKVRDTECIRYCTHPLSNYNEIIYYLKDEDKFHSGFI